MLNYSLLITTSLIVKLPYKRYRIILASVVGGLCSGVILLPVQNGYFQITIKLLITAILILIAYPIKSIASFIKSFMWFLAFNCLLAGIVLLLVFTVPNDIVMVNNLQVYFDISPILLVGSTLIMYISIKLFTIFMGVQRNTFYNGVLKINGVEIAVKAFYDSGFCARDIFFENKLALARFHNVKTQLPKELLQNLNEFFTNKELQYCEQYKLSIMPLTVAGGEIILPSLNGVELYFPEKKLRFCKVKLLFMDTQQDKTDFDILLSNEFSGIL